jgi:hypothetical protein
VVRINFRTDRWSAYLNGVPLFLDQEFYTGNTQASNCGAVGLRMTFGTWTRVNTTTYSCLGGSNYILFDNFSLEAAPLPSVSITSIKSVSNGLQIRWLSEAGYGYKLWRSADLASWSEIHSTTATGEFTTYTDTSLPIQPKAYYRVSRIQP